MGTVASGSVMAPRIPRDAAKRSKASWVQGLSDVATTVARPRAIAASKSAAMACSGPGVLALGWLRRNSGVSNCGSCWSEATPQGNPLLISSSARWSWCPEACSRNAVTLYSQPPAGSRGSRARRLCVNAQHGGWSISSRMGSGMRSAVVVPQVRHLVVHTPGSRSWARSSCAAVISLALGSYLAAHRGSANLGWAAGHSGLARPRPRYGRSSEGVW